MIKFDKVSYSFPQKDLYTDVSFTIEEGQHCAFIGASGSGKSTLIDILNHKSKYNNENDIEIFNRLKPGEDSTATSKQEKHKNKNREEKIKDK